RLLGVANQWYAEKELTEAFNTLCDVIRVDASCGAAWTTMGLIREEQGKLADALHLYTVAAHLSPKETMLWEQLYTMHMQIASDNEAAAQAGDQAAQTAYDEAAKQALDSLGHIVKNDPSNQDAWRRRLDILETQGDYKSLARAYRMMLRTNPYQMETIRRASVLFAKQRNDIDTPIKWFAAAMEFYNRQSIEMAEQAAQEAPRQASRNEHDDLGSENSVDLDADSDEEASGKYDAEWAAHFAEYPERTVPMEDLGGYGYSDLNMLAELRLLRREYDIGIAEVKRGARFVQGRGRETIWESAELDEMDAEYSTEHDSGERALPVELRIKLGQFRLLLGHEEAAKQHIDILYTLDVAMYEDLYTDVAEAYTDVGHGELAIEIYKLLVACEATNQPAVWERLAKCYREQGDLESACKYAQDVIEADASDMDMRMWLGEVYEEMGNVDMAFQMISDVEAIQQRERAEAPPVPAQVDEATLARRQSAYVARRRRNAEEERRRCLSAMRAADVAFRKLDLLRLRLGEGDQSAVEEFCHVAQPLYSDWRHSRAFYSGNRHRPFQRYRTAIQMSLENDSQGTSDDAVSAVQRQVDRMKERLSRQQQAEEPRDEPPPPTTFRGIAFTRWFDMFLHYGKCLVLSGDAGGALDMLDMVFQANVFIYDTACKRMLKLMMLAIAVRIEDVDRVYELARWWCGTRPTTATAYKLFAYIMASSATTASMLVSNNVFKFVRRQLELLNDLYYKDRPTPTPLPVEADLPPLVDGVDDGQVVVVDKTAEQQALARSDVAALHSLAAHVMLDSRTYAVPVAQYTMALSMTPQDASVALHLGVTYLRQSARHSEPRPQAAAMQGMVYIARYAELRCIEEHQAAGRKPRGVESTVVTQEIAYNYARAFHFLGILDLAARYYRQVFELPISLLAATAPEDNEALCDLRRDAAYNLASIYTSSGAVLRARSLLKQYCTM
ncbi:transcription factor TFIIIC subunit tfc4, partial [Coemansia sp. RSA 2611]